jgi:DNA-binding CsgD family transcriptional regulator
MNGPRLNNHFTAAATEEYNRDLLPHCPRVAAGIANPDLPLVCDYMLLSEAEMDRNAAYDWYGQHGLRYFIGAPVGETARYKLMWSVQRTPSQGHAQARDVHLFELLRPHVSTALTLADQIGTLRSIAKFSSAMVEGLPHGLLAVDAQGAVLFANSRAESHLRAADGLVLAGGRLSAALRREQTALERLIRDAATTDLAANGGWTRVSRTNGGPPYAIFVAPLKIQDEELLAQSAKVLVIVHDTGEHHKADAGMLGAVYGLTDAEARLASALSAGHSIESAAANLGVQVTTARSQLQSVFRKVGVNRQQDLTRILASLRV